MIPGLLVHLAETTCNINGHIYSGQECEQIAGFIGVGVVFFIIAMAIITLALTIGIAFFVLWVVTLVHVLSHEDVPDRIVWIVLHFIGLGVLAGPVYYFAAMRPYDKKHSKTKKA